jgi:hypothetical protein
MEGIVEENLRTLEQKLQGVIGEREWSTAYSANRDGKITYVGRYTHDKRTATEKFADSWGVMYGTFDGERVRIRKLGGYDHPVLRETRREFNRKFEKYEKKEEKDNLYSTLTFGVEC